MDLISDKKEFDNDIETLKDDIRQLLLTFTNKHMVSVDSLVFDNGIIPDAYTGEPMAYYDNIKIMVKY